MKIDAVATYTHCAEHILPIFKALPDSLRGKFYTYNRKVEGIVYSHNVIPEHLTSGKRPVSDNPILVAGIRDLRKVSPVLRPAILVEHGVGMSYRDCAFRNPSYPGGIGLRLQVSLILSTNQQAADKDREVGPTYRDVAVIGAPKLDSLHNSLKGYRHDPNKQPTSIAIATCWDCKVCPETRTALPFYKKVIPLLTKYYHVVIGHVHPRATNSIYSFYAKNCIYPEISWPSVMRNADLLISDTGSAMYEFASLNKPVVVLNCPHYRKNIYHGLRFWDYIPGIECDNPEDLLDAVQIAWSDPEDLQEKRRIATEYCYPNRGYATKVAVRAIERWLETI